MKRITESQINKLVKKIVNEKDYGKIQNYMFFSNLEQIKRQAELLLELDPMDIENIIQDGHDWADDHVTVAKENLDQVFDFIMNETKSNKNMVMAEGKKKEGTKLCSRGKTTAESKFDVYPSKYANVKIKTISKYKPIIIID